MADSSNADEIRRRSPRYPSHSLEQAVTAAHKIYSKDRRVATMREIAAQHVGYAGINGASAKMLGSLSQYGLAEEAGQGRLRLTERAEAIIHPKDARERVNLLNEALRLPKIFDALLSNYGVGQMPSDVTLKNQLIREHRYAPDAAAGIIKSLKESIVYVQQSQFECDGADQPSLVERTLHDEDVNNSSDESISERNRHKKRPTPISAEDDQRIDGPLSANTHAELIITGPLGIAEVDRLKRWFEKIVTPWAEFRVLEETEHSVSKKV